MRHICRRCGAPVLRVWAEIHHVDLDTAQQPIDVPLDGYEHHPTFGWHHVHWGIGNTRRGHPVHARHQCPGTDPSTSTRRSTA